MKVGLVVVADKYATNHCVVGVKGTFVFDLHGDAFAAEEQVELCLADEYFGEPESSGIRYPCDFVLYKPFTDVIINGVAHSPDGKNATQFMVEANIAGRRKKLLAIGDRS